MTEVVAQARSIYHICFLIHVLIDDDYLICDARQLSFFFVCLFEETLLSLYAKGHLE